jgi:hypothetical protein
MERITREAKRDAHAADLDPRKVLNLLWTGSEGERIWALGVLLERPDLATTRAVLDAVLRPDQMFDQEKPSGSRRPSLPFQLLRNGRESESPTPSEHTARPAS